MMAPSRPPSSISSANQSNARHLQWAKHFVDAEVLDIENVTEALETTSYGNCVYECENDVVDHQVVNIEYEGGVTASMTMSACKYPLRTRPLSQATGLTTNSQVTEAECARGTRIQGTKGELIGDMETFASPLGPPSPNAHPERPPRTNPTNNTRPSSTSSPAQRKPTAPRWTPAPTAAAIWV